MVLFIATISEILLCWVIGLCSQECIDVTMLKTLSGLVEGVEFMSSNRFNPQKLQKLNNPKRLQDIPVDTIWSMLNLPAKNTTLVEIGAGTAFFSIAFLEEARARKLYACDVSELMIDWVLANVVPGHPEVVPVKTEEETVPLQDRIADLVFMINLHHELQDPASLMRESFRLVKPGGYVLVIDWKKEKMKEGPPVEIRCESQSVGKELITAGFNEIAYTDNLEKHFIVCGKKT